jgi:hypothetical protein
MTETIKVEVNEALARKFRKKAMETYGYKKGAMKKALEESMQRFASPGVVDWDSLTGLIKAPGMTSVELQHRAWSDLD